MIQLQLTEAATLLKGVLTGKDRIFTGCSTDSRHPMPGALFIALRGERFDGHDFLEQAYEQGAYAALVDKPVKTKLATLQVNDTRLAMGKLARYWRQKFAIKLVAITGSNGKTSTKEMLSAIFRQQGCVLATQGNLNNDIGVPLTLFRLQPNHRYAVIEMGANHAGEIGYLSHLAEPLVAGITLCAPAHLEGFQSIDGVAHAKGEIFSGLSSDGVAVINQDDQYAPLWQQLASPRPILGFSLQHEEADITAQDIQLKLDASDFTLNTPQGAIAIHLPLPGRHNIMNALIASACALACDCDLLTIQHGLKTVESVKGRLQRLAGLHGSVLIDDSYNANPGSFKAALAVLAEAPAPRWLIMGDMNELGEKSIEFHTEAGQLAQQIGVERLLAVGKMSAYSVAAFGEGGQHFDNHEALIKFAHRALPSAATVLIKGSRGMHMEKIVQVLREEHE